MSARPLVGVAASVFLVLWAGLHLQVLGFDADAQAQAVTAFIFFLLILFRNKPPEPARVHPEPGRRMVALAALGGGVLLVGLVLNVRQAEWIGVLLTLYACLRWALPPHWSRDLLPAVVIVYAMHPLPGPVAGPLHLWMQRLSVRGSETVLHALNVAVWAQGTLLHTPVQTFEVPQACSGLRSVWVAITGAAGTAILFRFRLVESLVFCALAAGQVLALNIARIVVMVAGARVCGAGIPPGFLHDTTGIFLLLGLGLLPLEAAAWQRMRAGWRSGDRPVRRLAWAALVPVALLVALLLGLQSRATQRRPALVAAVSEGAVEQDPETAEQAARLVMELRGEPEDRLRFARILLVRAKPALALALLEPMPRAARTGEYTALKAWSLVAAGRTEEARQFLDSLSLRQRQQPALALAAAELGVRQDDCGAVVSTLPLAARSSLLLARVRGLFPYLAAHGEWNAIAAAHNAAPFQDPESLLPAVTAWLVLQQPERAASLLRRHEPLWRDDARYLFALAALAGSNRGSPFWRTAFEASCLKALQTRSADELCALFETIFRAGRPDLAWMAYRRLQCLAPDHPGLSFFPARFSGQWFTVRAADWGLGSGAGLEDVLDLRTLARCGQGLPPVASLLAAIPLAENFCAAEPAVVQADLLAQTLRQCQALQVQGRLSRRGLLLYADACQQAGDVVKACTLWESLRPDASGDRGEILLRLARHYAARNDWPQAYEAARALAGGAQASPEFADILLIESLLSLDCGLYALEISKEATRRFGNTTCLRQARARIWAAFGCAEQALFVLGPDGAAAPDPLRRWLLMENGFPIDTQRADRGTGCAREFPASSRGWDLPPADFLLKGFALPSDGSDDSGAGVALEGPAGGMCGSPFIASLQACLRNGLSSGASALDMQRWADAGRDRFEKGQALYRLALLQARRGKQECALRAVDAALVHLPASEILWRMRIALSNGDPAAIAKARTACPADPEIWLVDLALQLADGVPAETIRRTMADAIATDSFSPGTFVRAAECLLRQGLTREALAAAQHAVRQCPGYVPACRVYFRSVLVLADAGQALRCAVQLEEWLPESGLELKAAVELAMRQDRVPQELDEALAELCRRFPEEPEWRLRLGAVRFREGDMEAARDLFGEALGRAPERVPAGVFLQAAEAARRTGRPAESIQWLRLARQVYPQDLHVLNNLAQGLAETADGLAEASALLPELHAGSVNDAMRDTADFIARCLQARSGAVHSPGSGL